MQVKHQTMKSVSFVCLQKSFTWHQSFTHNRLIKPCITHWWVTPGHPSRTPKDTCTLTTCTKPQNRPQAEQKVSGIRSDTAFTGGPNLTSGRRWLQAPEANDAINTGEPLKHDKDGTINETIISPGERIGKRKLEVPPMQWSRKLKRSNLRR